MRGPLSGWRRVPNPIPFQDWRWLVPRPQRNEKEAISPTHRRDAFCGRPRHSPFDKHPRKADMKCAGEISSCPLPPVLQHGCPALNRTLPLVLAIALFMEKMDSTVIATSLPAIALDIGTNPVTLKLALSTYLVALAIFIPVSGFMADRFGAKRIFRLAIAIFVIGSIACALSDSLGAFVLSRFLQGMGGAMMTPVARLVLVRATPRNRLISAMAWLTVPALIGPITGPPLGGFIT